MCSERISNIKDLVRLSTKATLTVPAFLLTDAIDNFESYNDFAIALSCLKNDDGLKKKKKEIDDEFSEITLIVRDDKKWLNH